MPVLAGFVVQNPLARTAPQPADVPGSRLHIPDHLYRLSPWAKGTDELGPPGPVAALMRQDRRSVLGTFGSHEGWVAVSAVDGSYRFLDLPNVDPDTDPSLSPDGRRVGYVLAGDPPQGHLSHAVGFAIYDTSTAEVTRLRLPTRFGLVPEAIGWTGDSRFLVAYAGQQMADPAQSNAYKVVAMGLDGSLRRPPGAVDFVQPKFGTWGAAITWSGDHLLQVWNPGTGERKTFAAADSFREARLGPDGSRLVGIGEGPAPGDALTDRFYSGQKTRGGAVRAQLFLAGQGVHVLGWIDGNTVAVTRIHEDTQTAGYQIDAADVTTGVATPLITMEAGDEFMLDPTVASDLLRNPLSGHHRPDAGSDPRHLLLAAFVVLCGAVVLLLIRRANR